VVLSLETKEAAVRIIPFAERITLPAIEGLVYNLKDDILPTVYVDSPGGQFEFFSAIGPALQRRGITTLAGNVRSAAVILYILGYQRYATERSQFLFHEVRVYSRIGGGITLSDIESFEQYDKFMSGQGREAYQEWRRQMWAAQNWFARFLSNNVGIESGFFLKLMQKEVVMSADEAMYHGIVHKILPETILTDARLC
jgi:ATP-dependent protease ClpP protease subunit